MATHMYTQMAEEDAAITLKNTLHKADGIVVHVTILLKALGLESS